jgi:hypothetical protein
MNGGSASRWAPDVVLGMMNDESDPLSVLGWNEMDLECRILTFLQRCLGGQCSGARQRQPRRTLLDSQHDGAKVVVHKLG